jgi:hypothetical protein
MNHVITAAPADRAALRDPANPLGPDPVPDYHCPTHLLEVNA